MKSKTSSRGVGTSSELLFVFVRAQGREESLTSLYLTGRSIRLLELPDDLPVGQTLERHVCERGSALFSCSGV